MSVNFQQECFGAEPVSFKSAFMELPSAPSIPVSHHNYNPVSHNYNNYNPYAMRYIHGPSTPDYGISCNTRNSFPAMPMINHPLSHHPYLPPQLQPYPGGQDTHEGEQNFYLIFLTSTLIVRSSTTMRSLRTPIQRTDYNSNNCL